MRVISLHVANGDVTVERGSGPDTVIITSGIRGVTSPTGLEKLAFGQFVIRSSCGSTFSNDHCERGYVLRVRSDTSVTVDTDEGNVSADNLSGTLRLNSGESDVTVTGARGALRLTSGEGNISALASSAR